MKLYDYSSPPKKSRTTLSLDQIPSSESIHLEIAHEVAALDRALDAIAIYDYDRETMAYCCGKLGISVEQYQTLSTEDLKELLDESKKKIKALWVKIHGYYKKNYAKMHLYFMSIFERFDRLKDDFRKIRNKNALPVSFNTQKLMIEYFGFLGDDYYIKMSHVAEHLNCIIKDFVNSMYNDTLNLTESISVKTTYGKHIKELIEKQDNVEGQVLCITYCCHNKVRYIYKSDDTDNKLLKYKEINIEPTRYIEKDDPDDESMDFGTFAFYPILKLVKDNSDVRYKIKDVPNYIKKIEKECDNYINNKDIDKYDFKNILLLTSKLTMDSLYNILDNLKAITKCLKALRDDALKTNYYAYHLFVDYANSVDTIEFPTGVTIPRTDKVELVEKNDKIFIDLNNNWDAYIKETGTLGGFVVSNHQYNEHKDIYKPMMEDNDFYCKGGLIFIDRELRGPEENIELVRNSGITLEFTYYHEEGHIVNGQNEIPLIETDEYLDVEKKYFSHYIENSADAYACRKTGVSPSQLAEWRAKLGNKLIADNKEQFIKNVERYKGDVSTWKIEPDGTPSKG